MPCGLFRFSILYSDRGIEGARQTESGANSHRVSVSSTRIVGLKGNVPPAPPAGLPAFQYPLLGSWD